MVLVMLLLLLWFHQHRHRQRLAIEKHGTENTKIIFTISLLFFVPVWIYSYFDPHKSKTDVYYSVRFFIVSVRTYVS